MGADFPLTTVEAADVAAGRNGNGAAAASAKSKK
jgi:hypothetical protein